jgi:putative membrane protein
LLNQWDSFVNFLLYLGVSVPLFLLGIFIFFLTTPYREIVLIREGAELGDPQKTAAAKSAALDLGGKAVGLSFVLASAIYHSVGVIDLMIWSGIGTVFLVGVFYLFEWLTPFRVVSEIPKGNVGVGIFSAFLSIASGLIMASLISY